MSELNPNAINTLRIVTVRTGDDVYVFASEIRVGTQSSGHVDNLAAGGICVGVDEHGKLNEFGLCKYGQYKRIDKHPDTMIRFGNFVVPQYESAISLVCKAHKWFYGVKTIGWDVAITENGPTIIEGNDNWEISGLQAANGGLRKKWESIT